MEIPKIKDRKSNLSAKAGSQSCTNDFCAKSCEAAAPPSSVMFF